MTPLTEEALGKLVPGQEITVTDFKGVTGPGVITEVSPGGMIAVFVEFTHDVSDAHCYERTWHFTARDIERGGDYGLTLTFEPFRPAQREAEIELSKNLGELNGLYGEFTPIRIGQPEPATGGEVETVAEQAIRHLSRLVRVYGDMQDGNGNTPTEIRHAERFLAALGKTNRESEHG